MAETITISDNVKVEVGVRFNKYVKLHKGPRSIALAAKTWQFVVNNKELITKSLRNNSDFGLTFTQAKSLRVSMFRDQPWVTFCEDFSKDGKRLTKYVSLDKLEWDLLQNSVNEIQRILNYDVIYAGATGGWRLKRAEEAIDSESQMRLVPRMCEKTFVLQLHVYLITAMINKTRKNTCEACNQGIDLPYWHKTNGFSCDADWYTTVTARIDDVKQMINLKEAINTINGAMNWQMSSERYIVDNELLSEVTINHEVLPTCDDCQKLLPTYWNLYENLLYN